MDQGAMDRAEKRMVGGERAMVVNSDQAVPTMCDVQGCVGRPMRGGDSEVHPSLEQRESRAQHRQAPKATGRVAVTAGCCAEWASQLGTRCSAVRMGRALTGR